MGRHMWAAGLLSFPRPFFCCLKCRPIDRRRSPGDSRALPLSGRTRTPPRRRARWGPRTRAGIRTPAWLGRALPPSGNPRESPGRLETVSSLSRSTHFRSILAPIPLSMTGIEAWQTN